LLLGLVALTGCSLTLSGPTPGRSARGVPRCDTRKALVGVDGSMAGALGVAALVMGGEDQVEGALVLGVLSAGLVASAVSGNRKVNACREALDDYDARIARVRARPAPALAPAPTPPVAAPVGPTLPATPAPASAPAAPAPAPALAPPPAPTPAPAPVDDATWADFWKEVR